MNEDRDSDRADARNTREDVEREPEDRQRESGSSRTGGGRGAAGAGEQLLGWFTETMLRVALALVGLVLLLVALGQMVGVDTIGIITDALGSEVVQWAIVAVFALLLIVAATKQWNLTGGAGSEERR